MIVDHLIVGPLACNCSIVGDETTREAIVVDGGDEAAVISARLDALGLRAKYLVHTHAHIDHIGAVGDLRERAGGSALVHPADLPLYAMLAEQARWIGLGRPPAIVKLDGDLTDGETLTIGETRLTVHHTPGHTPGSSCFELGRDDGGTLLLTGDTLFRGAVGRWDLGGTSLEDIFASIERKLLVFSDETAVLPGHGPATTIGIERRSNPYLTSTG